MISRKLIRTDLNLLVALQILLEERNVTRAAERLSVSQPALSKTARWSPGHNINKEPRGRISASDRTKTWKVLQQKPSYKNGSA